MCLSPAPDRSVWAVPRNKFEPYSQLHPRQPNEFEPMPNSVPFHNKFEPCSQHLRPIPNESELHPQQPVQAAPNEFDWRPQLNSTVNSELEPSSQQV